MKVSLLLKSRMPKHTVYGLSISTLLRVQARMSIKKGIDRLSLVLAVIVMVVLPIVAIDKLVGWLEPVSEIVIVGIIFSVLGFLVPLISIRGTHRLIAWVITGFREEEEKE